ncbi:MAG: lysophospholipid acyltransferase family protein [Verrucomicrobiota bacterium]
MLGINQSQRHRFNYFLTRLALRIVLPILSSPKTIGAFSLGKGPVLLAGNHISHFDPPFLCRAFPQKVDFMAMKELFSHPLARSYFMGNDVFPVDRHRADSSALKECVKRLKRGHIVCMFPEGGLRSGQDSVLEGKPLPPGAGAVAHLAECPVQPFIIVGTDQLYRWQNVLQRPSVYVVLGTKLILNEQLPSKEARLDLDHRLEKAIKQLYQNLIKNENLTSEILPKTAQERWGQTSDSPIK